MALIGPVQSKLGWRANAALFTLLAVVLIVLVNRLGRDHIRGLVDLSEEQLAAPSPVGLELLAQLDDVLDVRAYFTGRMKIGPAQIAKRRLVDALERWESLADGKVRLSFSDPNESTEERVDARALGILSVPIPGKQGMAEVRQEVFLGLRLRLGEREAVIPWVLPQTLEQSFFSELFWLLKDEQPVLGFVGAMGPDFELLRSLFADRYALRDLTTLAHGDAVPESIDVLLVCAPELEHPRTVYEVEQFIQRGGRALFLVDPLIVDLRSASTGIRPTGYEAVLEAWGVRPSDTLVWDSRRANQVSMKLQVSEGGVQRAENVSLVYPPWPNMGVDGLSMDSPITASVSGGAFFWAASLEGTAPAGVQREELVHTTKNGYLVELQRALAQDASTLTQTNLELESKGDGRALPVAVALRGKLPSVFVDTAPDVMNAVAEAHFREAVGAATTTLGPWPERETANVPADPFNAEHEAAVVVIGDADFVRSGYLKSFPASGQLVVNAVDWLALSPELLALRARLPKERALTSFLAEEREALGLGGLVGALDADEAKRVSALEQEAQDKAAASRWRVMGLTLAGALLLALAAGFLARLWLVRDAA